MYDNQTTESGVCPILISMILHVIRLEWIYQYLIGPDKKDHVSHPIDLITCMQIMLNENGYLHTLVFP